MTSLHMPLIVLGKFGPQSPFSSALHPSLHLFEKIQMMHGTASAIRSQAQALHPVQEPLSVHCINQCTTCRHQETKAARLNAAAWALRCRWIVSCTFRSVHTAPSRQAAEA